MDCYKYFCIFIVSDQETMANRTVKDAHTVKGTNPQYLVEKIIRSRYLLLKILVQIRLDPH